MASDWRTSDHSAGDRGSLDRFVTLLESDEVKVRAKAARRLWLATGQHFAFDENEPSEKRLKQVAAWRAWVDEFGAKAQIRTDVAFRNRSTWGRTLVASYVFNDVSEYDLAGNRTWRVRLVDANGCWGLETGERVVNS